MKKILNRILEGWLEAVSWTDTGLWTYNGGGR